MTMDSSRNTRYLDIHHLRFQSLGGKHQTSNLACLCAAHHDMLHRSQLVILGEAPDLQFYRRTDEGALTELTDSVPRGRDPYSTS